MSTPSFMPGPPRAALHTSRGKPRQHQAPRSPQEDVKEFFFRDGAAKVRLDVFPGTPGADIVEALRARLGAEPHEHFVVCYRNREVALTSALPSGVELQIAWLPADSGPSQASDEEPDEQDVWSDLQPLQQKASSSARRQAVAAEAKQLQIEELRRRVKDAHGQVKKARRREQEAREKLADMEAQLQEVSDALHVQLEREARGRARLEKAEVFEASLWEEYHRNEEEVEDIKYRLERAQAEVERHSHMSTASFPRVWSSQQRPRNERLDSTPHVEDVCDDEEETGSSVVEQERDMELEEDEDDEHDELDEDFEEDLEEDDLEDADLEEDVEEAMGDDGELDEEELGDECLDGESEDSDSMPPLTASLLQEAALHESLAEEDWEDLPPISQAPTRRVCSHGRQQQEGAPESLPTRHARNARFRPRERWQQERWEEPLKSQDMAEVEELEETPSSEEELVVEHEDRRLPRKLRREGLDQDLHALREMLSPLQASRSATDPPEAPRGTGRQRPIAGRGQHTQAEMRHLEGRDDRSKASQFKVFRASAGSASVDSKDDKSSKALEVAAEEEEGCEAADQSPRGKEEVASMVEEPQQEPSSWAEKLRGKSGTSEGRSRRPADKTSSGGPVVLNGASRSLPSRKVAIPRERPPPPPPSQDVDDQVAAERVDEQSAPAKANDLLSPAAWASAAEPWCLADGGDWVVVRTVAVRTGGAIVRLVSGAGKAWLSADSIKPPCSKDSDCIRQELAGVFKVRFQHHKENELPAVSMWSRDEEDNMPLAREREQALWEKVKSMDLKSFRDSLDPSRFLPGRVKRVQPFGVFISLCKEQDVMIPNGFIPEDFMSWDANLGHTTCSLMTGQAVRIRSVQYSGINDKGIHIFRSTMLPIDAVRPQAANNARMFRGKGQSKGSSSNSAQAPGSVNRRREAEADQAGGPSAAAGDRGTSGKRREPLAEGNQAMSAEELAKQGAGSRVMKLAAQGFSVVSYESAVELNSMVGEKRSSGKTPWKPSFAEYFTAKPIQVVLVYDKETKPVGSVNINSTMSDAQKEKLALELAIDQRNDVVMNGTGVKRIDVGEKKIEVHTTSSFHE